jgi:hypothetical protein
MGDMIPGMPSMPNISAGGGGPSSAMASTFGGGGQDDSGWAVNFGGQQGASSAANPAMVNPPQAVGFSANSMGQPVIAPMVGAPMASNSGLTGFAPVLLIGLVIAIALKHK